MLGVMDLYGHSDSTEATGLGASVRAVTMPERSNSLSAILTGSTVGRPRRALRVGARGRTVDRHR